MWQKAEGINILKYNRYFREVFYGINFNKDVTITYIHNMDT